ncbi:MAG TPA: hypothetical protein VM870_10425 [Pyrinomonadaceae bacterium]|jgi:hypothetical protein|nr:hypothetical protein [Pyrinomonadaceae bacterium]
MTEKKKDSPANGGRAGVVVIPPHHARHAEEQRVAQQVGHVPGVIEVQTARHARDLVEQENNSFFARPGPVVTAIVIAALLFILTVAWFVAHEPTP